ncbi:hypothetical protein, partial [Leptolyngbya sp. FACHB-321]|uniref:hypothetical protein n=1 Tax=Leptolyngbya sp. FACHB-321 TaxID=2692807 RepID=UPI001A7EB283
LLDRLGAPRILDLIASLGAKATTFSCVLVDAVHEGCWRIRQRKIKAVLPKMGVKLYSSAEV